MKSSPADYPAAKGRGSQEPRPGRIQEAQAIALAGLGKALQEKGDAASKAKGAEHFANLEKYYPWSPKMLEVNYGTAIALHDDHQDADAEVRLHEVMKAQKASAELRAKSMLLLGKIFEADHRFEAAINSYIKISVYYTGVPKVAAEGLWRGAQLQERQGTGEIPMPTPTPKPPPGAKSVSRCQKPRLPAPKASSPAPKALSAPRSQSPAEPRSFSREVIAAPIFSPMLKRFASLFLLTAIVCLGGCEQKKTQAEVQAEKVKTFRKQQMDKAIARYKELIAKYPDSEFVAEAKARLQKLQPAGSPAPKK